MQNALYFTVNVGPYEKGLWYDNVPQEDFDTALLHGWGKTIVEASECGCLLVDGRAIVVREMQFTSLYCTKHLPNALNKPDERTRVERQATVRSLFEQGKAAGLVKEK